MAKKIEKANMKDVLRDNYMIYAESTIIDRSFPFIDGYKPVQRKVLYDMHELGLEKKSVKSARVVGDTMGKYHAHGDCLHSNTKLYLTNGQVITIKDAFEKQEELKILAFDVKKKKIVPAIVHAFRIGQYTDRIYHIYFSNGSELQCTANHPVLLKNYTYCRAEELCVGTQLYSKYYNVREGRPSLDSKYIQDIVGLSYFGQLESNLVKHHRDENPYNNEKENLQVLTRAEHALLHNDYTKGLALGRKSMFTDEGKHRKAVKEKNGMLRRLTSQDAAIRHFLNCVDIVRQENDGVVTYELYEALRGREGIYNLPKVDKLINKGKYGNTFEELVQYKRPSLSQMYIEQSKEIATTKKNSYSIENEKAFKLRHLYGRFSEIPYEMLISNNAYKEYNKLIAIRSKDNKKLKNYYYLNEDEFNQLLHIYLTTHMYVTLIEIEEVNQEPMYDFTVDNFENMLIPMIGDSIVSFISIHNSSIYGSMCQMADTVEGRNAPEIEAHGCFGRIWSTYTIPAAAMRYTEARLTKMASACHFNGLNMNAVDFVDNYDNTTTEPVLLPVMYPNIIVNSSSGVACGIRTYIPSYTLKNACEATIGLLNGSIKDSEGLAAALDAPDFQTGGIVNMSQEQKLELVKTGITKGVYLTSRYTVDSKRNELTIYEIPYNTNCEKIVKQIEECIKERKIAGLTRVVNGSDKDGLGIVVYFQRGYTAEEVFKYLCAYTDVQTRISFQTKFVHIDKDTNKMKYKEPGIYELLNDYWIPWRIDVIRRINQHQLDKLNEDLHKAKAWDIVGDRIREYVEILLDNNKKEAKEIHKATFGLDDIQEDALIANYLDALTLDGVLRMRDRIVKLEGEVNSITKFISDEKAIKKQIITELRDIIKKYALPRKSSSEEIATLVHLTKEEATAVRDEEVWIGITEKCKLKKAITEKDAENFESKVDKDDKLWVTYQMNNKDSLLVYTTAGYIYKLPVNALDSSARTTFKDSAWRFISKDSSDVHEILDRKSDIFYISPLGKGRDGFNIVYRRGLVKKIRYDMYNSKRKIYRKAFPEYEDTGFIIDYDEMLLITNKGRAIIQDITELNNLDEPTKGQMLHKCPKLREDEEIIGVYNLDELRPYLSNEMLERYTKKYWIKAKRGAYDITSILVAYDKKVEEDARKALEMAESEASDTENNNVAENFDDEVTNDIEVENNLNIVDSDDESFTEVED